MTDTAMYASQIHRELARIRVAQPGTDTVRRKYREADHAYRKAVERGDGSRDSGEVIANYYITRQAYAMYAVEQDISIKVG